MYLHYKIILKVLKPYGTRAGRGEGRQKGRGMNIILYYIILYIILYIYRVVNICRFRANAPPIFCQRFFFFDSACWGVCQQKRPSPHPLTLPQIFLHFATPRCLANKIKHLTKFSMQHSCTRLQTAKNSQKTLTKSIT